MTLAAFIQGSAHDLAGIADGSVQAIVTSPPYYGLRKYEGAQDIEWPAVEYAPMPGLPPLTVPGCDPNCAHEWQDGPKVSQQPQRDASGGVGGGRILGTRGEQAGNKGRSFSITQGAYCSKCGGLGNEPTLEAYIGHLVLCLREWRRVLRGDGCCFVNLGDSYAGSGKGGNPEDSPYFGKVGSNVHSKGLSNKNDMSPGLKPKDLMQVPARFALAAQADGWWLRSDIIGHKTAPMPESATDRPTRSHEHIYMLTKASRYYWDSESVREEPAGYERKGGTAAYTANGSATNGIGSQSFHAMNPAGRNMRDVIPWAPSPFPGAHFACWPEAIPERFIRAATSERGACPNCGAPWARAVERELTGVDERRPDNGMPGRTGNGLTRMRAGDPSSTTTGWQPTCTCPPAEAVPCMVLDPFSGSGTTAKVAVRLGRRAIGVDISAEYLGDVTAQRFGSGVQMELTGAI